METSKVLVEWFLLVIFSATVTSESNFEFTIKSLHCTFTKKYFDMSNCRVDFDKNKKGVLNGFGNGVYNLDQADSDLRMMSLNTNMLHLRKTDVCKFWSRDPKNDFPMKELALGFMTKVASDFAGGCPYASRNYTMKDVDVSAVLTPLLPIFAIPGEYKLWLRIFASNNETMFEIEAIGEITNKKNRVKDLLPQKLKRF